MLCRIAIVVCSALVPIAMACSLMPPFSPGPPEGPARARVGEACEFTAEARGAANGRLCYRFHWGIGAPSDWTAPLPPGQSARMTHVWNRPGRYEVSAQARDAHGLMSAWGPPTVISVLDRGGACPDAVVARLDAGKDPVGIAASPDGRLVCVAARADDQLTIVRTEDNQTVARLKVGSRPHSVCILPSGRRAYVANSVDNSVSIVDLETPAVIGSVRVGYHPICVAPSPDGGHVYVTSYQSGTVTAIRTEDNTVSGELFLEPVPWGVAVHPDGRNIYVTGSGQSNLFVIRAEDLALVGTTIVRPGPEGLAFSPDGRHLYVACHTGALDIIRTADNRVVASVQLPSYPVACAALANGRCVYVSCHTKGLIHAISPETHDVIAELEDAGGANYLAALPDSKRVYVCCNKLNQVWVLGVT